jgi:hypothetical protein
MVSSLGKNLLERYEDQRMGRGGGEGHRVGLKGIKVTLKDYSRVSLVTIHGETIDVYRG